MKKRFIQILLIIPCIIIDGFKLFLIVLPYWLFTGDLQKFNTTLYELFEND